MTTKMETKTVVVQEISSPFPPIYTYPLMYDVPASLDAEGILDHVALTRASELGCSDEDANWNETLKEIKDELRLAFSFPGDVQVLDDWRK